jgi:hypothetical protein
VSTGVVDRRKRLRKMLSHLFAFVRRCLGDPDGMWFTKLFVPEWNANARNYSSHILTNEELISRPINVIFALFMLRRSMVKQ